MPSAEGVVTCLSVQLLLLCLGVSVFAANRPPDCSSFSVRALLFLLGCLGLLPAELPLTGCLILRPLGVVDV